MSRRFAVVSLLVFVLALLVGGTVLADGHLTRYDDTKSAVELEGGGPSLICNGAFDPMYWGDSVANLAQCWTGYDSDATVGFRITPTSTWQMFVIPQTCLAWTMR